MVQPQVFRLAFLGLLLSITTVTLTKQLSQRNCIGLLTTKISEGRKPGSEIFKFFRHSNFAYSFTENYYSSSARELFKISREGLVSNLVTLDHEDPRGRRFTLTVLRKEMKANGKLLKTTACSLVIHVQDLNDNSPKFRKDLYVGTILENSTIGSTVQGLEGVYAVDLDSGTNADVFYKVSPTNGADSYFEAITEDIGGLKFLRIKTRRFLDREDIAFFVLTVEARDGGSPTLSSRTQIRINVLDENDCTPVFKPLEYSVDILSSTPVTTSILKVHAQDDDEGANGEVYYFLKTTRQSFFTIDPHTGEIRIARELGFAGPSLIVVEVVAQDRGKYPRSTSTVVKVNIRRDNHHGQHRMWMRNEVRFAKRSYVARVYEDMPIHSHVLHANLVPYVTDAEFRILSDEILPFRVDGNSSVVYLTGRLDYETTRVYQFKLEARFRRSKAVQTTVRIEVNDVDKNYFAPVFEKPNIAAIYKKVSNNGAQLITKLKAIDKDENVNGLAIKYHVRGGNGINLLSVDQNLGEVYLKPSANLRDLDRLELVVEARDSAVSRPKSAKQFLVVNILGARDYCTPVFARPVYFARLRENAPRDSFVVVADAQDCTQRRIAYSITSGNDRGRFTIDGLTGIVRTTGRIDREEQEEHILEITAKSSTASKAQILVKIEDVNDQKPVFVSDNYEVHISENRGRVDHLLCLVAKDKDSGENGTVRYEIRKGNEKHLFAIDANTGTLSSRDSLNFEDQQEHVLIIQATDHGDPPLSSDTTVRVLVTNINDPPKFTKDDIEVSILEQKPIGSTVVVLQVSDEDTGTNGEFVCSYENIDQDEFGKFEVKTVSNGCEVRNLVILDWFEKNVYSLKVRVTDKAPPRIRKSDTIEVTIKINDINNHAPEFTQDSYRVSIPHNTPLSTSKILKVKATDKDSGLNAEITYAIVNHTSSPFTISRHGSITLNRRPYIGTHEVLVLAKDKGNPERRTHVTCFISVYGRRISFPPKISGNSDRTLLEDAVVGTVVRKIRLRGKRNRNVKYVIVGGNIGGVFNIRPNGDVQLVRSLDYERVREYKLVVQVVYYHQKKELAIEVPLKVRVLDVNDNRPRFALTSQPLVIDINKRMSGGVVIAHVSAFDPDAGENGEVTYAIKQGLDPIYFAVHPKLGVITATKALASRDAPYTFTLVVEDGGNPRKQSEHDVHVRIHRDSDAITFEDGENQGSVDEGPLGINTRTTTLRINHRGDNDVIYRITTGDPANKFCVDVTGAVRSITELDRESQTQYFLDISASDGETSAFVGLNITVNDINDNSPQFPEDPIRVFTKENARAQKIGKIKATDRDWGENGTVHYEIISTSSTENRNMFDIEKSDGTLIITGTLDHEQCPEHVLTVAAIDEGSPSRRTFARVIITVEDENDHSPEFVSRNFMARVPFNAPRGYEVLQTLATDQDSAWNGEIRYAIHPTSQMFAIDETTGWISVASVLSMDPVPFLVSATDKGNPERSDTARVTLIVEPGAGPPRFIHASSRRFHATVAEDRGIGEEILNVTAASRSLITYAIEDSSMNDFLINGTTGKITIAKSLDFERRERYEFTVSATDRNDRRSIAHLTIQVENVNDNKPRILNKNQNGEIHCQILRHAALGTLLTRIEAQDNDTYDRLSFSLGTNQTYFTIDTAGNIRTKALLRGVRHELYFGVIVKDTGKPTSQDMALVRVVLLNYDLTRPGRVSQLVSEDTPVRSIIALSPKIYRPNRHSRFSIVYPQSPPFTVQPIKGNLVLVEPLDYEQQAKYSLTVRMGTKTEPLDYVDVNITVVVKDENDNRPEFLTAGDNAQVHIKARQRTLIKRFRATDKDSGINGEVEYRMGDEHPGLFQLGRKSGELRTNGVTLVERKYNVSVEAYDKGTPSLSTRTFIMVEACTYKPQFSEKEYEFAVKENVTIGEYVGKVTAQGFGLLLTYEIIAGGTGFSINPNNGVITLLKPVDHEKIEERVFRLKVLAKTQQTSTARVTVHVSDVNDCAPKFYTSSYVDTVPESAPLGTTVLRVHAIDDDSGLNGKVRYSLANEPDFLIDSYTGVVTTAAILDYEVKPLYKINVVAHDRGTPRLMGTAQLTVNVKNVNDNRPVFTLQIYESSVWENARKGSLVTTVRATDADKDIITYDITAGNDAGAFVINPTHGVIKVSNIPSASLVGPLYHLNVSASDGIYTTHAMVRVNIKDINDHAPVFSECHLYSPSVPEGSPPGTPVLRIRATDSDLGPNGEVEYGIVHPSTLFQIDRKSGLIQTAAVFNRQKQRSYSIRVKAVDGNSDMGADVRRESSCLFTVTISDINDNKPIFKMQHYETSIKENIEVGRSILQVRADDMDEGANSEISYAFKPKTPLFKIDLQTGIITTQANLINKDQVYRLRVTATDNGDPRLHSEVDVTINVLDSKINPPKFQQSFYEVSVPENIIFNSKIIRVSADTTQVVYYRIIPGNVPATNNPRKFVIDALRGEVQVQGELDRESTPNYTLTIQAENNHIPPLKSWTILRVLVTDVNDCSPEFTQSEYMGSVPENSDPGTPVLTVTARDRDKAPYNKTVYSISWRNKYFDIEKSTGVIRTKVMFDREERINGRERSRYKFVVKATDEENPSLWNDVIVTVRVTDVNDWAPMFAQARYNATVYENAENGTKVATVFASDKDVGLNAKITYHIESGDDHNMFRIDSDTGRVEVNGDIDYEEETEYELTVSAWDGKHNDTTILRITVENENDNTPMFYSHGVLEVPENSPPGTVIANLNATDRDLDGKKFTKMLRYGLSDQVDGIFRIDAKTGRLQTEARLDRETKNTYIFEAYVHDGYGKSGSVEVIVRVRDVNDHAPMFTKHNRFSYLSGTVYENKPPGTFVKQVQAEDRDDITQGGNAVVRYHLQSDPHNAFSIEKDTGKIRTRVMLDRENKRSYVLMVNASDGGKPPLSSVIKVVVHVRDVNDHAPKFDAKVFEKRIPENISLHAVALRLGARDEDEGENAELRFSMSKNTPSSGFKVDAKTGEVIVKSRLDYEKQTSYEFEVEVQDCEPKSSDTAKLIIHLEDCNDNAPYFTRHAYNNDPGLPEGRYDHKRLLKVEAHDDDSTATNKELYYNISDGDPDGIFKVDSKTGELFVVSELDYEKTPRHVIKIRATNTAPPKLYGETEVTIKVTDINDNLPELTSSSLNQGIFENLPEKAMRVIGTLYATDRDNNGGPFTFWITEGGENFQVDRKTGKLTTNKTFDRERQARYTLMVWVQDSGKPPLTNKIAVTVNILDRNDNQHNPGQLELTVNLMAHHTLSPTTPVGHVFVDDEDTDDPRYYDMTSGDANTFKIDRDTGDISLRQKPLPGLYTFVVKVSDRNSTFRPVDCTVRMTVNEISMDAFKKSVSLRIFDLRREEFIRSMDKYKEGIAKTLDTRSENVDLFSVQNAGDGKRAVDVRFAAHGSPYYEPERMIGLLKTNRDQVGFGRAIRIGYDACASEPCQDGRCRTETIMMNAIEVIDDGFGQAFTSVAVKTKANCGKCTEDSKTGCESELCKNSSCVNTAKVFAPSFPVVQRGGRMGPSCGLTTRSFVKGDWVWLQSLKACPSLKLSLEFSTLKENGLLLYNGPVSAPGTEESYDYIAVQLVRGKIHVGFSLGESKATNMVVDSSTKLNDGDWHLVEIVQNHTLIRVTVDQCRTSLVKRLGSKDIEDRRNCESKHVIREAKFHALNVDEPLQLGGISSQPPNYTEVRTTTYDGCIRHVKENDVMFDLKQVLNAKGSKEGCGSMDKYCQHQSPCYGAAQCIGTRNDFRCICPPGYEGKRCDVESVDQTFTPPSFIKYQLENTFLKTYNPKFTTIEMMVRTRDRNGAVLMSISKNGLARLQIRLKTGVSKLLTLEATVNLGDDEQVVELRNALPQDGFWHHVIFTRDRNEMHLGIDPRITSRKASGKGKGDFIMLNIAKDSEIFIGGLETTGKSKDYLDGCIKDVRIDGQPLPNDTSNDVATATKIQGVTQGCLSGACETVKCSSLQFCHDMWRKYECLYRPCNSYPCHNGGKCLDEVVSGIATFKCACRAGFNGTTCARGSSVIMLTGDAEVVSMELIIGLSCFVFILILVTTLVICYHRYQTKGKTTFNTPLDATDGKKRKRNDKKKKGLVTVNHQQTTSPVHTETITTTTSYPSMYSNKPVIHTCADGGEQAPAVPTRDDSLQECNGNTQPLQIPVWDIPPMIDVVFSPADSSSSEEDYMEEEEEDLDYKPNDSEDEASFDDCATKGSFGPPEDEPKQPSDDDRAFKVPSVSWNDIEEFGRKFYTMTRDFLGKDDETHSRNSAVSTISNSSSVITVVENQQGQFV